MKKHLLLQCLLLLCAALFGTTAMAQTADYTLDATKASNATTNNAYASTGTVTVDGIDWAVNGNGTTQPWRIGGKSLSNAERTVYTKTAYPSEVSQIDLTVGAASSVTVNSLKLQYSTNADFSDATTLTKSFAASSTISFAPESGNFPKNAYYKFIFNVTVSVNSNKFIEFKTVEFYNAGGEGDDPTVAAPKFTVAGGTYTEAQTVKVTDYSEDYIYVYTTNGTAPAVAEDLTVTSGTLYNNATGISIGETCTLKMIAVDEDGNSSAVTTAAYTINIPKVYGSLEDLVADELTTGTDVTVSFAGVPIKSFQTVSGTRKGVYFDIQKDGKDIEIYFNSAIPAAWEEGGLLTGTISAPWKLYSGTWELAPASGWSWTELTYTAPAGKTLTAIAISGEPAKTSYRIGDQFDVNGLTVTATYSDETQKDVTAQVEWTMTPATFTEAGEVEATIVATLEEMSDSKTFSVTVSDARTATIDLSTDQTTTATSTKMEWVTANFTITADKDKCTTATNNYYPGTEGKSYTSTRFYTGSKLTIAPASGKAITEIVFTATSTTYATKLAESTWTNATATANGTTVTVTPTAGEYPVVAAIGGATGHSKIQVTYVNFPAVNLPAQQGDDNYATFSSTEAVEFAEDVTVYAVAVVDNELLLSEVASKQVPAGTGVLLKSANTLAKYTVIAEAPAIADNYLKAAAEPMEGAAAYYRLAYYDYNEKSGLGFYYGAEDGAAFTCKAGTAYLALPAAAGIKGFVLGADNATAISSAKAQAENAAIYNLAGQKIQSLQKGINIVNGKKIIK